MDLIVFANDAARNVSGVTTDTTCAQIVYALAHATNQKGRFVLVSTFSNSNQEHRLTPDEKPLVLVQECAEKSIDIAFELRRLPDTPTEDAVPIKMNNGSENILEHKVSTTSSPQFLRNFNGAVGGDDNNNEEGISNGGVKEFHNRQQNISHHHQSTATAAIATANHQYLEEDLISAQKQQNALLTNFSFTNLADVNSKLSNLPHQRSLPMLKNEIRSRPPPPAYNHVIEQRCNSLTRNISLSKNRVPEKSASSSQLPTSFSAILNLTVNELCNRQFTQEELKNLVEAQRNKRNFGWMEQLYYFSRVISAQKNELVGLELTLSNDAERELVQLKKQHNNLQTVLNSLRNADWKMRVDAEQCEAERLHTAVDAMKTAIENKRRELFQISELQRALEMQLYVLENNQQQQQQFENNMNALNLQESKCDEMNTIIYS